MSAAPQRYPFYKRLTSLIVLIIFGLWTGYVLLVPNANAKTPGAGIANGAPAPDFALKTPDGKSVKLSDFKGKPVMINFFATWCSSCKAEMPALEAVYEKYKDQGFTILAVNLGETNLAVTNFMKSYNITFPVVIDADNAVTRTYDIIPLPTSYFVDKNGVVQGKWTGEISKDKLEGFVKSIQ